MKKFYLKIYILNISTNDDMFNNISSLISVDLSNFKGSSVKNKMDYMFNNCINLKTITLSNLDLTYTTNISFMFNELNSLINLTLYNFNESSIIDFSYMFNNIKSLKSIDLSKFKGSKVNNTMQYMFNNLQNLKEVEFLIFDMSNCIDFSYMFNNCPSFISLNLTNFKGSKINNNMEYMFNNCNKLESIDLSNLDISFVTDITKIFKGCNNLKYINLSNLKANQRANFSYLFNNLDSLISIDLSNFKGSLIDNRMDYMFNNCNNLKSIIMPNLDLTLTNNISHMFNDCKSLIDIKINNFNKSSIVDYSYMFNNCNSLTSIDLSNFEGSFVNNDMKFMFNNCTNLITLNLSSFDTSYTTTLSYMFNNCNSLKNLIVSNLNISSVSDFSFMFNNCSSLSYFNHSLFKNSSINNTMEYMFNNCTNLTEVDLSNFKNHFTTNIKYLLNGCFALKNFKLSSFDISSVADFSYMFKDCNSLNYLDLSDFKKIITNNNMEGLFYNCSNLISLNLTDFDTSKTTNMKNMFYGCNSLTSLNFSKFKTSKVINMEGMFEKCQKLTSLDLLSFDTHSVTNMISMFSDCNSLKDLQIYKFKTQSVQKMDSMFKNCNSILSLDLSTYKTPSLNSMSKMFFNCNSLIILHLSSFDTSLVTDMSEMFSGCSSLQFLDISQFTENEILNVSNMFNMTRENLNFVSKTINKNDKNSKLSNYLYSKLCPISTNPLNWKNTELKYIPELGICIDDCKNDNIYNYEYKAFCYEKCPENTRSSFNDEYLCEIICPEERPYEIVNLYDCVRNCSSVNFFRKECKINNRKPKYKDDMTFNIDIDVENGELDLMIMNHIQKNKSDLLAKSNEMYYQITSSENQNNISTDNFSILEIGEIEDKIKDIYNMSKDENLIIFKTDIMKPGYYIPIIEYSIYNFETNEKLNLNSSLLDEIKLNVSIPVKINETILYKHDPFSIYYNDMCISYTTDYGTDIIMNDRFEEYGYYNYSLCEKNCEFLGYDNITKKANCKCKIKHELKLFSNIIVDTDLLFNNFISFKSIMNIEIIKCYKTVLSYDGLIKNAGNYIMLFIIIIFIITFILFFVQGYNKSFLKANQISSCKMYINENEQKQEKEEKKENKGKKGNKEMEKNFKSKTQQKWEDNNEDLSVTVKRMNLQKSADNFISVEKEKEMKEKLNKQIKIIMKSIDVEINSFPYEKALIQDKRTFFQYYFSLLKINHLIIFSFYPSEDYNLKIIKVYIFFFSFALYLSVNALFFTDATMHKIYIDKGVFNFIYQIPQIFYSTIISAVSTSIIKGFAFTDKDILDIKQENRIEKLAKLSIRALQCILIKFIIFSFFNIIFLFAFWYYLSCFCSVYKNTQSHLLSDAIISFSLSLVYPLAIYLLPTIFRIKGLRSKNKCLYKISKLLQMI